LRRNYYGIIVIPTAVIVGIGVVDIGAGGVGDGVIVK
jgi:hypothetical protein